MAETTTQGGRTVAGEWQRAYRPVSIPVVSFGLSLSLFFAITYALCVLLYLLFPELARGHAVLTLFLPWFELLSWQSFLIGLAESLAYGWYIALIFGPLFNFFAARAGR